MTLDPPSTHHVTAHDGTDLVWRARGSAASPSIILTNGLSTTSNFWRPLAARLTDRYRVVDWDYRGHGESEGARSNDYSSATFADDLRAVTEAAEAARGANGARVPPVQVAFSMGVTVLLELYRRRPDLVGAMVLIAGVADYPYASTALFRIPGVHAAVRAAVRAASPIMPHLTPLTRRLSRSSALFPIGRALGALGPEAPRGELEHFFRAVGSMDIRAFWGGLRGLLDAHTSDVLPIVRVPVLVIAPGWDVMAPRSDLELLRRRIPRAQWTRIPGTGHAVLLEAGAVIAEEVRRFLGDPVVDPRLE